jgi:hypothetical protein
MCVSPPCRSQMAHTLTTPQPLKSNDNSTDILIGNKCNPIDTNGDAQIM